MATQGKKPVKIRNALCKVAGWLAIMFLVAAGSSVPSAMAEDAPPDGLALTIAPPVLLADGSTQTVIYLQLLGFDDEPRLASQQVEISLVSSNPHAVVVPDSVLISPGSSYTVASLDTTSVPGKAVIRAVGIGHGPVTAEVETISPLQAVRPFRLALAAAPGKMLRGAQPSPRLSVLLLGINGRPLPAPENLNVVLRSADPAVVRVVEQVTIPKGAHFVSTDLEPAGVGSTTLSAVHSGYTSEFIEVHVVEPGDTAEALVVYLSPPVLRAGNGDQPGVIVQAVDNSGAPVYFPCTQVTLASSSPLSVEVSPVAEGACDWKVQYALGTLTTGHLPGTATITAVVTGMRPATATLAVQGHVPAQLKAYLTPKGLLGIEANPGFIVVQVLDSNGVPVKSHGGIAVTVAGSGGLLEEKVLIEGGQSFLTVDLSRLQPGDQMELWFVNPGLTPTNLSVKSQTLPTDAQLVASERPVFLGDRQPILVLASSTGRPLPNAMLNWTAINGTLRDVTLETDAKGEGRAIFLATEPGDGLVEVTVNKAGYREATAQTRVDVVAPVETRKPRPKLLGIPVWVLFLICLLVLLGYFGVKFLPTVTRQSPTALLKLVGRWG